MTASRRLLALLTALVLLCTATGGLAAVAQAPARDSFSGAIHGVSGAHAADRGHVTARLAPAAGSGRQRAIAIVLSGRVCRRGCRPLTGRLRGTIVREPAPVPDVGERFLLSLHGKVAPFGRVGASGSVHGTGFEARGRESLRLTLHTARGDVAITAQSGLVRGFTSP